MKNLQNFVAQQFKYWSWSMKTLIESVHPKFNLIYVNLVVVFQRKLIPDFVCVQDIRLALLNSPRNQLSKICNEKVLLESILTRKASFLSLFIAEKFFRRDSTAESIGLSEALSSAIHGWPDTKITLVYQHFTNPVKLIMQGID